MRFLATWLSTTPLILPSLLLALGAISTPASAQSLRILESTQAAPASTDTELASYLESGEKLRSEKRWRELTEHYKRASEVFPQSTQLQDCLHAAQAREDVERRYADPSFQKSVRTLSDREAIDLYSELLVKVENHYVETPNWDHLVKRGVLFALEALKAERLQSLSTAGPQAFTALRSELNKYLAQRPIANVRDAREAAWFAGQLAKQRTGIPAPTLMLEFVAGATAALDTYSSFLTPDQLDEVFSQIEGNFVGLGIELEMQSDALRIVNVIPGGPAHQAGVKVGDRFVELDGKTVAELGPTVASNALRGEEGTSITVVVVRKGEVTRRLQIVRRTVEVPSVVDTKIVDEEHKIGYFKLASFQKSTSRDVDDALWTLHKQGMQSLIMDLRGNPGGLLDAAVQVADKFLTDGSIVSTRGRTEQFAFSAHPEGTWSVALVVLIDGDSASASEILAGALRDHGRAHIVGSRSYGKGSVQGIFPLSIGKAGVRLTTAKFYSPSGRAISKNGVLPTTQIQVAARVPLEEMGTVSKDYVLNSAVQVALGQKQRAVPANQNAGLQVSQTK